MLHDGPVSLVSTRDGVTPAVVLCSVAGGSYRQSQPMRCDFPGYEEARAYGPMRVLVARSSPPSQAPP